MDDCKIITTKLLHLRIDDIERNLKLAEELEVEEVKLFGDDDHRSVKIRKNLPTNFK